ncbi:HDOD domain-containing protein [Noviherbaspirillum galbum]|uniref:HDOD domain-containing protein n=1 Tax=Noviherbaspirillum galbum TaxID=2709383 RepID=A0A6B3SRZ0_9BURK|nr:HDOD domain-containing protein [Noviherbaspirillum galbum]NEX61556.1 HDOD domain-containing protein [Noviherbaspirillum galbum]
MHNNPSAKADLGFWLPSGDEPVRHPPARDDKPKQEAPADPRESARDRLIKGIGALTDLPALGSSVSRVVQMTSSDDEAVRSLANFILSDVALTQRVLRIANTVSYRTASAQPVTTVSKAIFMLGFDTVKTSALAMMLVDRMNTRRAQCVRTELNHALCASIVGREMAKRTNFKDAEEAAVAALFKNIGRLLVAAYDHELYTRIAKMVEAGTHTPAQASAEVLGCSFDYIAESVLRDWNIPDTIIHALANPPAGVLKQPKGRQEWLQQVAAFSSAAARLIPGMNEPGQEAACKAILTRFGGALGLDAHKLAQLFGSVAQETRVLASNTSLPIQNEEVVQGTQQGSPSPGAGARSVAHDGSADGVLSEFLLEPANPGHRLQVVQRHASGKPTNASDLLMAGVQDMTQMMASGRSKVNDLMLLVLETLYNSMGFRFATVCLKDLQSQRYRARISMGENFEAREAGFSFPAGAATDIFHLALEKDADIMVSDATVPKIRDLLPGWHRSLLGDARSFVILPLVVHKKPIGLFYADRALAAPEGVPPNETALIKMLKGQVVVALQTR